MNRNHLITLTFIFSLLFSYSCSENTVAPNNDEEEGEEKISATISIITGLTRTFVGESIKFESSISKDTSETQLYQRWTIEPTYIANIDSSGEATILDFGKAFVITSLYDKQNNLIASDTVHLYSEAEKKLELEKLIQSFTKKNDETGIFVGSSNSNNLYLSSDYGDNWNLVTTPVPNSAITNITRSVSDPNYLMATYRESILCCNIENFTGIIVSEDNGTTWSEITHPFIPQNNEIFSEFSAISFAPDHVETLYALTRVNSDLGGIRLFKSINLGATWQVLKTFDRNSSESPSLFIDDEHNLFVAVTGHVSNAGGYVSQDRGDNWVAWARDKTERLYHIDDSGILYGRNFAGTTTDANQQIVYSNNNSRTWEVLFEDDSYDLVHIDTYESDNIAVLMLTGIKTGNKIKFSTDAGHTWKDYKLSFANLIPYNRPSKLKIMDVTDETMEILCFWGNSNYGDEKNGQVWKLKIFYGL